MTQAVDYSALLKSGSTSRQQRPPLIVLHADKGVGKTTFASQFPSVALISGEDGAGSIIENRWPNEGAVESWDSLLNYTRAFAYGDHKFKTLAVDTCGPLSALAIAVAIKQSGKDSWEKMGWGKDEALVAIWRVWLSLLETCRNKRGMTVVLLMHSALRKVNDPKLPEAYYNFQGDIHQSLWAHTFGWADIVLYGAREMAIHTPENGKARAMLKKTRWLHSQSDTGFEAKTRTGYRLPPVLELTETGTYERFMSELRESAAGVRDRIGVLVKQIGQPDVATKTSEFMKHAGDSIEDLRLIELKLKEMIT